MLSIDNLSVFRQSVPIVQAETISVACGEHLAMLGPNGAGKSSLLKAINGEWPSETGNIELHHKSMSEWPRQVLARHLGVLPQASQIEFPFTAAEVVAIGATPLRLKRTELTSQVKHFMSMLDVHALADQFYSQLSGGERQRVQLARVLLQLSQAEQAPLLLLDEPISAQDLKHQHLLMQIVNEFCSQQHYMVMSVLHDLNIASRYCQSVLVINNGRIQQQGTPEDVLTPAHVSEHWCYEPEYIKRAHQGFALL